MYRPSQMVSAVRSPLASLIQARIFSRSCGSSYVSKPDDFFEYTSGKWLWNDALRQAERKKRFDAVALKRLAANAVGRSARDIAHFEKFAEGGFNRTFLLTMRDGFQMIARIPYPITEPKNLLIASEVATINYLRARNIPVPSIYDYSTAADNPARTEYIFMEVMRGRNLGDIWYDLGEKARVTVVEKLVELESRLFSLDFPAGGSLYYTKDLDPGYDRVQVPSEGASNKDSFSIGPDLTLSLWYARRRKLSAFRGPYRKAQDVLAAGAQKEVCFLKHYGRPLLPLRRLYREFCDYEPQSPSEYTRLLLDYLRIHDYIVPHDSATLSQPKIRHPDLQPNNVFVSDDLEITGLIDWQHTTILPLFLQGGIPGSLQNHGDEVSESLEIPTLPESFDNMDEDAQFEQILLLRRRQLHYYYVKRTMESSSVHREVLIDPRCVLRRKLFSHASAPWEGDNVTLKADLIDLTKTWPVIACSKPGHSIPACPIEFSEAEQQESSEQATAIAEADIQLRTCLDLVGAGPEGWVPFELYDGARSRAQQLLEDTLESAESDEEREQTKEH